MDTIWKELYPAAKFGAIFEMPDRDEIDVWVEG